MDGNGEVRVRFDRTHPDKTISLEDAEAILIQWRERNPAQFGYWLAKALTGTDPRKTARTARAGAHDG